MFWNNTKKIKSDIQEVKSSIEDLHRDLIRIEMDFQAIPDKIEDYMKNAGKINGMINEFKGCVAMARGAICEGKELTKEVDGLKALAVISQQIYNSLHSFITSVDNIEQAHHKIDVIYNAVCHTQSKTKKRRKRRKTNEVV